MHPTAYTAEVFTYYAEDADLEERNRRFEIVECYAHADVDSKEEAEALFRAQFQKDHPRVDPGDIHVAVYRTDIQFINSLSYKILG